MNFSWMEFYEYSSDEGIAATPASQRARKGRTLFSGVSLGLLRDYLHV